MRYNQGWVTNCFLLRVASPRAYRLVIEMNVLPLTGTILLTQLIGELQSKFGFESIALEAIYASLKNKPLTERYGTLVLDENKLRQSFDFNRGSYNFNGFVNYRDSDASGEARLTDNEVALVFVPLFQR